MNSKQKCFKNPDKTNKHLLYTFNPIKAGRSESMYHAPPPEKGLEGLERDEMHVHSQILQGQLIKKISPITIKVWC